MKQFMEMMDRFNFLTGLDMDELAMPGHKVNSTDATRSYTTWEDMFNHLNANDESAVVPLSETFKKRSKFM